MSSFISKFNSKISKVGVDKILHDSVGGRITSTFYGAFAIFSEDFYFNTFALSALISFIGILGLALIKENMYLKTDYKDIIYTLLGWLITTLVFALLTMIHILVK